MKQKKNKYGKSATKLSNVVYYIRSPEKLFETKGKELEFYKSELICIVPQYPEWKKYLYWQIWFWASQLSILTLIRVAGFSYENIGTTASVIFAIVATIINAIFSYHQVKRYEKQYYAEFE